MKGPGRPHTLSNCPIPCDRPRDTGVGCTCDFKCFGGRFGRRTSQRNQYAFPFRATNELPKLGVGLYVETRVSDIYVPYTRDKGTSKFEYKVGQPLY